MKPFVSSPAILILTISVIMSSALAHAMSISSGLQTGKTAADGVYTEEQSTRGQTAAQKQCTSCHGAKLEGSELAPPLSGQDFLVSWKTLADLNDKIQTTMPADAAGTLTPQQAADLLAYLLKVNNFPAGSAELAPGAALAGITLQAK